MSQTDSIIQIDSRLCMPGSRFYAFSGTTTSANHYITNAVASGAVEIFTSEDLSIELEFLCKEKSIKVAVLQDSSSVQKTLVQDLQKSYPVNYKEFTVVAITGTDGKTSTVHFARELAGSLGYSAASIGTIGMYVTDGTHGTTSQFATTELTTPDIVTNHMMMYNLQQSGIRYVFIEYSSIGIHQNRLDSIYISGAVWTTLGSDHLDYHKTLIEYIEQKSRLFTEITPADSFHLINKTALEAIPLGHSIRSVQNLQTIEHPVMNYTDKGIIFSLENQTVQTTLYAGFLGQNMHMAIQILLSLGLSLREIAKHTIKIDAPIGRFECITGSGKQLCIVDYAHTPDALEKLLVEVHVLRKMLNKSKIYLVIGAGGDRDKTKRSRFGSLASAECDYCIVTDDNPRTEDPGLIRQSIIDGMDQSFRDAQKFKEIADRRLAISTAIEQSNSNDIVVIAGKGHEDYQIIGKEKFHLSDQEEVKKALYIVL